MKRTFIAAAVALCATACLSAQSGSEALIRTNNILSDIKTRLAPDKRQVVFEIKAHAQGSDTLVLKGATSETAIHDAIDDNMRQAGIEYVDSITVYPADSWAQIRIPAASLRTNGAHSAEMATQAVLGTPVRLLDDNGEWWRVQTPDGYIAYVPSSSAVRKTTAEMRAWRANDNRYIVTSLYQVRVYNAPDSDGPRDVVTDLVNGCIVVATGQAGNNKLNVVLPDGRSGWLDAAAAQPIAQWAAQNFDPDHILDIAYSMEGTPYLWGGTSTKALDCSGLAKVSYYSNGIILMRDASQQATTGTRIEAADWRSCQPGDLLFFGTRSGRVTHVAIYDHDGNYVHSSGRVKRNSVDPESDSYLTTPFLHAVRIAGNEGTRGITQARNHPWFFNL